MATKTTDTLSAALAGYLTAFNARMLNEKVRTVAEKHILDLFGTMLAAASPRYSAGRLLAQFVDIVGGHPVASVFGQTEKTSVVNAALVNGTLAYYCDVEAHHPESVMHAPAAAVPAALAMAESQGSTGEEFLAASVLGIDVGCRISMALDPRALYARGFHPSAVAGAFGATAAAGWLLHLTAEQWHCALGLCALQACGLLSWASDHTEHSRPFNIGVAARNGVTAALLASQGFGGPPQPLDGKYSIFDAFSGVRRPEHLIAGLGSRFAVSELAIKQYACCAFLHPGLDALLDIMNREGLTIRELDQIDLHFPSSGAGIIDNNELKSHCAQYILPVAAASGQVTIDDILADRRSDPDTARLSSRVRVVHDDSLDRLYPRQYSTIVAVSTRDGRRVRQRVDWPKGHPMNPLTDDDLFRKYLRMAGDLLPESRARRLGDLVLHLDEASSLVELCGLIRMAA